MWACKEQIVVDVETSGRYLVDLMATYIPQDMTLSQRCSRSSVTLHFSVNKVFFLSTLLATKDDVQRLHKTTLLNRAIIFVHLPVDKVFFHPTLSPATKSGVQALIHASHHEILYKNIKDL